MLKPPDQHALEAAEAALAVAERMLGRSGLAMRHTAPSAPSGPGPTGATTQSRSGPARHVAEALPFLGMPLDEFARVGASLEVRVPWLDVTLWMVPTERDAARLMAEGVRRGRIWTATELMQLMQIAERTPETVKTVTHAKLETDGEITEVRRGNAGI